MMRMGSSMGRVRGLDGVDEMLDGARMLVMVMAMYE